MYKIRDEELERVRVMRDLGVLLDEKLTFSDHVEATIRKANRALGLMMRTFQTGKNGRSLREINRKAVIATYCANVRSILEYASVVWNGAAATHLKRVERVQQKFLMWLSGRCREPGVSYEYESMLAHFNFASLAARRDQHDIMFIRNVHYHVIDSSYLLERFPLSVPPRSLRNMTLFSVPYARVNTVKSSPFCRIPKSCNSFLEHNCDMDFWNHAVATFKRRVITYVRDR